MLADLPIPVARVAAWNAVLSETNGGRVGRCRRVHGDAVSCAVTVQLSDKDKTRLDGRIVVRLRAGGLALTVPWDLVEWY